MKTVTKKLFAMLLVAVMLLSAVPFGAAAAGVKAADCTCPHEHGLDAVTGICADCGHEVTDGVCYVAAAAESKTTTEEPAAKTAPAASESEAAAQSAEPATVGGASTLTLDAPAAQGLKDKIGEKTVTIEMTNTATAKTETVTASLPVGSVINLKYINGIVADTFGEDVTADSAYIVFSPLVQHNLKNGPHILLTNIKVQVTVSKGEPAPDPDPDPTMYHVQLRVVQGMGRTILPGFPAEMDVVAGSSLNLSDMVAAKGYVLKSVVDGASNDLTAQASNLVINSDISLTVTVEDEVDPEPTSYSVIFAPEGGYWTNASMSQRHEPLMFTVEAGGTVASKDIPGTSDIAADQKSADFLYWKNRATGEKFTAATKINGNVELVPEWATKKSTYTITFDPNGGSLRRHEDTMTVHYKEVLDDLPIPSHKRMDFKGWFDETGREWEDGDIYNIAQDLTLTAKWAKSTKVVLHIYMDGNTKKSVYDIELDGYSVGDTITMKHVRKDVWDAGISAKPGKKLEYDGLFDADTWERYVRRGRGGEDAIEIEDARHNDIYVMVFNGQTSHRPWDPTNPKTGDQMMLEAAIAVMGLTAVGFVVMTTLRKKKVL